MEKSKILTLVLSRWNKIIHCLIHELKYLGKALSHFFYPPHCLYCQNFLDKTACLCTDCLDLIEVNPEIFSCFDYPKLKKSYVAFSKIGPLHSLFQGRENSFLLSLFTDFLVLAYEKTSLFLPEVVVYFQKNLSDKNMKIVAEKFCQRLELKKAPLKSFKEWEDKKILLLLPEPLNGNDEKKLLKAFETAFPSELEVFMFFR